MTLISSRVISNGTDSKNADLTKLLLNDDGLVSLKSKNIAQISPAKSSSKSGSTKEEISRFFSTTAPQSYYLSAAWEVGGDTKIAGFPVGTKVVIAATVSGEKANKLDFLEAAKEGMLYVAVTLPGQKTGTIGTYTPSTGTLRMGKVKSVSLTPGGEVVGFATGSAGAGTAPSASASGFAGVSLEIPGSKALANVLANAVTGVSRTAEAVELAGTAGTAAPAVVAQEGVRQLLAATIKSGRYYVGFGWTATGAIDQKNLTLTAGSKKVSVGLEDIGKYAMSKFASDTDNYGISEVAFGKNRYQLGRGTSYFQLAAISQGRNHGDNALQVINLINAAGRKYNLLESRIGPISDDGRYVKLWRSVSNGKDAEQLLGALKKSMPIAEWTRFTTDLAGHTLKLGVNFGQRELAFDPSITASVATKADKAASSYLLRDYRKTSKPQEYREILRRPSSGPSESRIRVTKKVVLKRVGSGHSKPNGN
jgi:hypothetical protein